MAKEKTLKNGNKRHELTRQDSVKGGQVTSPVKALSSRINGLMNSKDLTDDQRYMHGLLRDRKFVDLIMELVSMNLEEAGSSERRDKVIDQLSKLLPTRNINLDVSAGQSGFRSEDYVKFRDAVFSVVSPEQREEILERSRSVGVVETTRDLLHNIFLKLKEGKEGDEQS